MAATSNPILKWAQRKDRLFVTVDVQDIKDESVTLTEDKLVFTGTVRSVFKPPAVACSKPRFPPRSARAAPRAAAPRPPFFCLSRAVTAGVAPSPAVGFCVSLCLAVPPPTSFPEASSDSTAVYLLQGGDKPYAFELEFLEPVDTAHEVNVARPAIFLSDKLAEQTAQPTILTWLRILGGAGQQVGEDGAGAASADHEEGIQ